MKLENVKIMYDMLIEYIDKDFFIADTESASDILEQSESFEKQKHFKRKYVDDLFDKIKREAN